MGTMSKREESLRKLVSEPGKCPDIQYHWYCDTIFSDCTSYKVKRAIMEMEANKENLAFYFNAIVAPAARTVSNQNKYINFIENLDDNRSVQYYDCIREGLLVAYCDLAIFKDISSYLQVVSEAFNELSGKDKIANAFGPAYTVKGILKIVAMVLELSVKSMNSLFFGYASSVLFSNLEILVSTKCSGK